ncbi:hypothetical protein NMY22_g18103 [Coprinellus aureogranulatus]|nr:hypothetical protein NMY22_g18103 [Coprinellus aureogranulatus]
MENQTTSDTNSGAVSPQSAETPGLAFQLPQASKETDTLVVMAPDARHAPRKKRSDFQEVFPHPTPLFIGFSIIPIVLLTGAFITFIVMWIRQRRQGQLKRLYLTDYPMIYPRRPVPKSLNSYEDLEDAVQTLSYERYKSGKPSSQPKESKLRIVSNRLKRRERQEGSEKLVPPQSAPTASPTAQSYASPSPIPPTPIPGEAICCQSCDMRTVRVLYSVRISVLKDRS